MDPRIRIQIHAKMSWIRNTELRKDFGIEPHSLPISAYIKFYEV
jgi:hypothetical protein